jgi:hypothetical protein
MRGCPSRISRCVPAADVRDYVDAARCSMCLGMPYFWQQGLLLSTTVHTGCAPAAAAATYRASRSLPSTAAVCCERREPCYTGSRVTSNERGDSCACSRASQHPRSSFGHCSSAAKPDNRCAAGSHSFESRPRASRARATESC